MARGTAKKVKGGRRRPAPATAAVPSEGTRLVAAELIRRRLTRKDAERELRLGHGYFSRMFRGARGAPELDIAVRFRDVLGVPVDAWLQRATGPVPTVPRVSYDP